MKIMRKPMVALLSDHKLKQGWFARELLGVAEGRDWKTSWKTYLSLLKRYETIQVRKNNALYVGVRRGNHHILRPLSISASEAREQIRTVNDAVMGLVSARLRDDSDDEPLDRVFSSSPITQQAARSRQDSALVRTPRDCLLARTQLSQTVIPGSMVMWEDRRLRDITEADLRQIMDAGLEEHVQLEYKSALYDANDRGNRESLLDICMFANAGGDW